LLSLAKLGPGVVDYLEEMVAQGVEEYYVNAKEAPGQWLGRSLRHLELDGTVDGDEFRRVLSHTHPATGNRLTDGMSSPKVVGFDATFCAPKSVSLLFALGAREASNEVRNSHDIAVRQAFDVLQSVARGRRDHNGIRLVEGDGLLAAAYRHRTSRAAEPHLHTHVVIPNLVYAPEDQRWSALDARPLYAWCKPAGHLYQAQLRYELARRLGVRWQPITKGMAEVAGFERTVLRAFSTRRRDIEDELERGGLSGAKAAQQAAYKTRTPKDHSVDGSRLLASWHQQANALGLDQRALDRVIGRGQDVVVPVVGSADAGTLYARLASPCGLTAKRSTFDVRHVIEAICNALPNGAPVSSVLELAAGFLASEHVIPLDIDRTSAMRRTDGTLVPSVDGLMRFTTPEMIVTEQQLLARAALRRHDHAGATAIEALDRAIAECRTLSDEQVAMVRTICRSGAGVEVVEGIAGSGKTTALRAAARAWTSSGYGVRGCALAARAAARLHDGTGIPSCTLDRLLSSLNRGESCLTTRHVVVVDEAAMVGTRKLHELLDHADRSGAKVVLIGDPRQLPEIDAGGAFAGLNRTLGGASLTTNRRQRESWERAALQQLRAGDADAALNAYRNRGRIHEYDDARAQMVRVWCDRRLVGEDCVMLAVRVQDVEDLNCRARRELQHRGQLRTDEIAIGDRRFTTGDEVLALRNDYAIGVLNGTRMTVEYIDHRRGRLYCVDDHQQVARVPLSYIVAGDLAHAYAMTVHKAQGATVDQALVLADDTMAAEHAYTALSRASVRTDIYVETSPPYDREAHAPTISEPAANRLRTAISRTIAQRLAVDQAAQPLVPVEALMAERRLVEAQLTPRPPDHRSELHNLLRQIRTVRESRVNAIERQQNARQELERLGSIGRLVHRHDRKTLENLEQWGATDVEHLNSRLVPLIGQYRALTIEQREVDRWERNHQPQLQRIGEIDRAIALRHLAARSLQREPPSRPHAPERSLGLEL
jgi:conjugative relaxase-like TrwC/TraI family protein